MMIPLEFIQNYIIDKLSQNDNALLNLSGGSVQQEILMPTMKSENFLSQIKITKVQLNEGDDYLMVDLYKKEQKFNTRITKNISNAPKKRKLRKSIGVV
jgi:6-phosphogluconolactonase/glucosamine-6-phosphate isomerase/deaminase